jgi:thiamine-phosphate pyrophosphorylase
VDLARQLCDGVADLVQLRAKTSTPDGIRQLGESILKISQPAGVGLVINDHPQIALEIGAFACHLGQEDFFGAGQVQTVETARWRPQLKLGLSTHSPEQARRALEVAPDYIAIGPVYATPTKPTAQPVTLDYVRWAAANIRIPWFAIGGISTRTLDEVLAAGATRICVVSAILNAPNVTRACQQFKERLSSAPLK